MKTTSSRTKLITPVENLYRDIFIDEDMKWESHPDLRAYIMNYNGDPLAEYVAEAHSPKEALEEASRFWISLGVMNEEGIHNDGVGTPKKLLVTVTKG